MLLLRQESPLSPSSPPRPNIFRTMDHGAASQTPPPSLTYQPLLEFHKSLQLPNSALVMDLHPYTAFWIMDYLTGWPQYVRVDDCASEVVISNTGAPQGTVLAPFLFTLYTSDFHLTQVPATFKIFLTTPPLLDASTMTTRTDRELCHMVQHQSPEAQYQQYGGQPEEQKVPSSTYHSGTGSREGGLIIPAETQIFQYAEQALADLLPVCSRQCSVLCYSVLG